MKCPNCRSTDIIETREDHHYTESGLSNVYLEGIPFRTCRSCGWRGMGLHQAAKLHKLLAETIATRPARLVGEEIRFLRKFLGYSGKDFAAIMGVSPEQVSRWENDREAMGAGSERALRLFALRGKKVEEYPNERFKELGRPDAHRPAQVRLVVAGSGWAEASA